MNRKPTSLKPVGVACVALTMAFVAVGCDDTADEPGVVPDDGITGTTYDESVDPVVASYLAEPDP